MHFKYMTALDLNSRKKKAKKKRGYHLFIYKMKILKETDVPTSNLPELIKEHMNIEDHPFCDVKIIKNDEGKIRVTIVESDRDFYE